MHQLWAADGQQMFHCKEDWPKPLLPSASFHNIFLFLHKLRLEESGRFTQELGISIERIRILRADWELKYLPVYSACFIVRPRGPYLKPQSWLVADLGLESVGLYLQSRFFSLQCSANEETKKIRRP